MARPPTGQVLERRGKRGRVFAIRYRAPGYGRVYETLGEAPTWDRARAEQALEDRKAQIRLGVWEPPRAQQVVTEVDEIPTFWTFAEHWYEQKELEVDTRTREHMLYLLNKHLVWFGRHRVDEITEELVDEYRAFKLREGRLSPGTINKTLRLLARILDKAVRRGYLERNPARGDDSRLNEPSPRRIWLELDEVQSLLGAAGDYRRELATLTFAGLRISELGGLHWRAIDFAKGTLTVEESKTEAGEWRRIDLTPLLLDELKSHWAEHPTAGLDDLVFPTMKGRPRDRSNSRGRLRTILKRANAARAKQELPPIAHLTNHTLRRTFASLMYEAGAQPTDVMAQMGHKSSKLALEVYAKRMNRERDTGARMDALVDWAQMGTRDEPAFGAVV
jgi:integrase